VSVAALCLVAGALTVAVPTSRFTLAWQHSVEKVLWEEDYLIAGGWMRDHLLDHGRNIDEHCWSMTGDGGEDGIGRAPLGEQHA